MNRYFFKFQAAGNDFILFDDRRGDFPKDDSQLITQMCDRKFGIGSDGVLLIQQSNDADMYLDFINPDGSRSFCGNGSRCGVLFASMLGMFNEQCTFGAIDGIHHAEILADSVRISMGDVAQIKEESGGVFLNTGSPHLILSSSDVESINVQIEGAKVRYSPAYEAKGVNVNFVERIDDSSIRMRTYERGVEAETLSCGTGVTAAALALASDKEQQEINVLTRGGKLSVKFKRNGDSFEDIWLRGPAVKVFSGEYPA